MTNDPTSESAIPASVPTIRPKAAPTLQHAEAEVFYTEAICELAATDEGRRPGGTPVYNVAMQVTKPTGRSYALLEI
jgi:hypothetical protein